ncbi:Actin-related protein 2/3 complex subunit 3 [Trypanosoma melophagium]|uniref:Actin-related protein 2/3 complex subunit 3 n=1 Tax=Trypanosoma melophagium TaxID=715481 RepID=UPI00351A55DC|nr:Actin-related protein 2/3 complex subunit 3 [Trypanosoma melophagium]
MHSRWNGYEECSLLGCGVYPLRLTSKFTPASPAPRMVDVVGEGREEQDDIVDEALYFFKPHMFFRTFPIKGAGDRVILYLTMYLHGCLEKIIGLKREEAVATLISYATLSFASPGDENFRFNSFFPTGDQSEQEKWREYAKQIRMEAGIRLIEKVFLFPEKDGTGNKFWMAFAKRPFLTSD